MVNDLRRYDEGLLERARGKKNCNVSGEIVQAVSTVYFRRDSANQPRMQIVQMFKCVSSGVKVGSLQRISVSFLAPDFFSIVASAVADNISPHFLNSKIKQLEPLMAGHITFLGKAKQTPEKRGMLRHSLRQYLLTRIAVTVSVTAHFSAIIVTTGLQNSAIIYTCHTYCRILQFYWQNCLGVKFKPANLLFITINSVILPLGPYWQHFPQCFLFISLVFLSIVPYMEHSTSTARTTSEKRYFRMPLCLPLLLLT